MDAIVDWYILHTRWTLFKNLIETILSAGCVPFPLVGDGYFMPYVQSGSEWTRKLGPDDPNVGATCILPGSTCT